MSEEIKDIFECLKKYANLTPDAIDDLYYLEGTIEDLQQKVEQLEKELQTNANECKQLENIRKEAIKTIEEDILGKKIENVNWDYDECYYSDMPVERVKHLLNILNKGSEK